MSAADSELICESTVFFDIDAADKADLFRQLQSRLAPEGYLKDNWLEAIETREAEFATGLQTMTIGIAIPHADNCVEKPYIAIVKPKHPVQFEHMGGVGETVNAELIINLGIVRKGGQVEVLQALMNVFMNEEAVADIMSQETPADLVAAMKRHFV